MPHGCHIYSKASNMTKSKMCAYPQSDHAWPHCKFVLRCCANCPSVNIPEQEKYDQYSDTRLSIRFQIYHLIAHGITRGRLMLNDSKNCRMCKQYYDSEQPTKVYTRKELVIIETTISNFHTSFFIPEIQKLTCHLQHVKILGINHCDESCWTEFKWRESFQDVLCRRYYAERVVASFAHQIQS